MSSATEPKVIELYGFGIQHEAEAGAAITPGLFVRHTADKVVVPGFGGAAHVATEYSYTGRTIDDDYAVGDQVVYSTYAPGSSTYSLVAAGAAAIAESAELTVAADGTVAAAATGDTVMAIARDALDNSAGADRARLRIQITTGYTAA